MCRQPVDTTSLPRYVRKEPLTWDDMSHLGSVPGVAGMQSSAPRRACLGGHCFVWSLVASGPIALPSGPDPDVIEADFQYCPGRVPLGDVNYHCGFKGGVFGVPPGLRPVGADRFGQVGEGVAAKVGDDRGGGGALGVESAECPAQPQPPSGSARSRAQISRTGVTISPSTHQLKSPRRWPWVRLVAVRTFIGQPSLACGA